MDKLIRILILLMLVFVVVACGIMEGEEGSDEGAWAEEEDIVIEDEEDEGEPVQDEEDDEEPGLDAAEGDGPSDMEGGKLPRLEDVEQWLYLIDVNLDEETAWDIEESSYDMVVIDFIISEENNTDYPMAEVIESWHQAEYPKLVIAYIDIGQAEDFRTYWQEGWEVGDPEWIVGEDPDGWVGNYPVAFWYDDYREIWLGEDGYMQEILEVGFDGIYLDWVEAYSDTYVIEMAEREGVDPVDEIVWWVTDLGDYGRNRKDDFVVIAQNAAELVEVEGYVDVIDAISQEQVWFDGGADNEPPGDCPLPRTEDDVETDAYVESLSPLCREQYAMYP